MAVTEVTNSPQIVSYRGSSKTAGTTLALTAVNGTVTVAVGDVVVVGFVKGNVTLTGTSFAKTGGTCTLGASTARRSEAHSGNGGSTQILTATVTGAGTLTGITVTHVSVTPRGAQAVILRGLPQEAPDGTTGGFNSAAGTTLVVASVGSGGVPAGTTVAGIGGQTGPTGDSGAGETQLNMDAPTNTGNLLAEGSSGGGATSNQVGFMAYTLSQSANAASASNQSKTMSNARGTGSYASVWWLPPSGAALTQDVNDTASVADSAAAARGVAASPADTATVADAQSFGFGEGVTDTAAVADAASPAAGFSGTVPDTATVADSATAARGVSASPADTATVADATTQLSGKEASIADSISGSVVGQNVGGTKLGDDLFAWDAGQTFTIDFDFVSPVNVGSVGLPILGATIGPVALGQPSGGWVPIAFIGLDRNLRVNAVWHGSSTDAAQLVGSGYDDGVQRHMTITYDGASQRTYIDGTQVHIWTANQTSFSASYSYFAGAAKTAGWPSGAAGDANGWSYMQSGGGVGNIVFRSGVQAPLTGDGLADNASVAAGFNKTVPDTATVADAQTPAAGFRTTVPDTAAVADAQTPSSGRSVAVPDTATVADAQSFSYGFNLSPGDTATVADAATASAGFGKTVPDTATVADAQAFGYGPGITDTAAVADSQSTASNAITDVADTATVADASTASAGFNKSPADTATVADSQSFQSGKEAVVPDTATVADAATASAGFNKAPVDTATVADSASAQSGKETTIPDTLTVADAQSTAWGAVAAVADTATVADAQSFQFSGGTTITDAIGVADSLSTSEAFAISTSDPAAVADALRFDLSASLADALSVADALTPSHGWAAQVSDTLIVADAATTASGIQAALADNISVADATATARAVQAALADTANVADAQSFERAIQAALADTAAVADATTFTQDRSIAITDILVVADARALGISKAIDDALDVDDLVSLIGSGASSAYIHHVPPLRGDIEPNDSSGLVAVVATNEIVAVYSASGLVVAINTNGEVVATGADGDVDEFVTSGLVLNPLDEGVNV